MHPVYRFLLGLIVCALWCVNVFANVSITPATGGTNISADKSAGSSGAAYTTLGDIKIGSGVNTDYAINQNLVTFTLSAPANWQFQAGGGSAVGAGTVTVVSTIVTSSDITVTFNTGAANIANAITISGIKVQCTAKTILAVANITRTAGSAVIANFTNITANNCGSLSQAAGTFVKLQLLLPGEVAAPGTATGKTSAPTTPVAGANISATVNAVDENWNLASSTDVIQITATDANVTLPANAALVAGTKTYTVVLKTAGVAQTITATDVTTPAKTANTSPSVTPNAGTFVKLQLLMPGETATPGTASGKTGTPTAQTAGTAFNITVNAVDANWNKVSSVTDNVAITSSDPNATLPANAALSAGSRTFAVTLKTTSARTVTATDVSDASKTLSASPSTTVNNAGFSKLQILLPGETASPGSATGKTGTPTSAAASVAFTVTVNAVDAYWNLVSSTDIIGITSSDGAAVLPPNAALVAGTKTFSVTLKTFGPQTVTATDATDASKTAGTSASVTVSFGAFTKMQLLLPGETAAPGTTTGKTGTPTAPVAGTPFNVIVNAVDANWYVVTTATDVVGITSTDANAVLLASTAMSGGTATLSVAFRTAASKTLTATDITTAKTVNTSPAVTVSPASFSKLQVLMPGETAAPGTATGKTGSPTARSSGTAFSVTVNAVDAYWNKVSTITDVINLTSNDASATLPANAALVAGTKTNFSVKLRTLTTTATITATDVTDGSKTANTSTNTTVVIGAYSTLQLLLPGETAAPGTSSGKTGTSTIPVAGTPINITVNAVDAGFNIVTSATPTVKTTSTDPYAVLPANTALTAGTASLSFTFKRSGSRTITATDAAVTTKKSTSPTVVVAAGAFVKLQLLLPGETADAGSATGKTGTPNSQSAGTAISTVIVNAVDANWNKVTSVTDVVQLTTTDPAAVVTAPTALVAGTKTNFSVNFKSLGSFTVTATDQTNGTKTANTSPAVTVGIGAFTKLQILLPGETAAPGTTTGKTGTPNTPVAGTPFIITVNAVDAAWNVVTSATDNVSITSTDLNAVLPANANLVAGTKTFSVTLKTAISPGKTITATDVTNGTKTAGTSPAVIISPAAYSTLQLLLPGEVAAPGTATGKKGAANPPARGTAFTVIVNAVDAYYNLVNTVTNSVTFTSSDGSATLPATTALVAGTKTFTNGVKIVNSSSSPLPTLTVTNAGITTTISVPLGVTPTATTDYFRSVISGDWNNALTWESSVDGINWQDATITPTNAANTISIIAGTTVTVTANVTADQIVVNTNAQVIVNSGITLTLQTGGADVSGTLANAGVVNTVAGALKFLSGSKYQHTYTSTAGTIPTATWDDASTCEIIGYTSATGTLAGGNQTFGNLTWNCPNQNVSGNGVILLGNTTASIKNLTVTSTGTGQFSLFSTGGTLAVRSNYVQSGGITELNKTSGTASINVAGDFTLSGGTITKGAGLNLVSFNGTTTQNFVKTGGAFSGAINFTVNTNAILNFSDYIWDGSTGNFTLNSGGTILTNNDDGFTATGVALGSIQNTGTRTYNSGGNYTFNGNNAQSIGNGLPLTVNNLTVNNAQGVIMPAGTATYTINGLLNLNGGNLNMGTNALLTGPGFTNSGTGSLQTQNTSATPIPGGITWNIDVEYNGTGNQTVVPGTYTDITFTEAGTKTAAAGTILVKGNWSSTDGKVDLTTNNATIQFTGTAQTLNDDGGNGVTFNQVTFGNTGTKTLASGSYAVAAGGVLTMAGTATLASNDNLVLMSDSTGSATVAAINTGASITGNVDVQRFIKGNSNLIYRGYRLLSSPVSSADAPNAYYSLAFLKGSGSYLTGPGGATNGFDVTGAQTLYLYRDDKAPASNSFTTGNYRAINMINNIPLYNLKTVDGDFNMPVGNGFLYFFRGNEGTTPTTPPEDVILNATGVVNQGQIVVKNWFRPTTDTLSYTSLAAAAAVKGFSLVGNPYPSSIDWNTAYGNNSTTTGIYARSLENAIYIYNATTKNYSVYTSTGTSSGVASGSPGGSSIIPAGQGFFVRATDNNAKLIFNETAKVNTQVTGSNLLLGTPVTTFTDQHLRLQLAKDNINKDEAVILFNAAATNAYKVNEDVLYLKGTGAVSLANMSGDNKLLAINQLALPKEKQSQKIRLSVSATTDGIYQLNLTEIKNIPALYDVWLMDSYKKDSLDIKDNPTYNFNIYLKDTASFGANRFVLVIKQNTAQAYHLLDFNASQVADAVQIKWKAENEADYTYFTLERSVDGGKSYDVLQSIHAGGLGSYSYLDKSPAIGNNLYRLKQEDINGVITYSKIETVAISQKAASITTAAITVFPNPTNATLNVNINNKATGKFLITITNSTGRILRSVTTAQPGWSGDVSNLLPGSYFVQATNTITGEIVGRASFIKL